MDYLDFELEIASGNGSEYPVAVVHSVAGEAHETMHFPFDEQMLANQLLTLQHILSGASETSPQSLSVSQQTVQTFGQALFTALFTGDVRDLYVASRSEASSQGKGLRLKLHIQPTELAILPWEFLYDPDQAQYLCLSDNTPVVRYLDIPQPPQPLTITPPLSILGMAVSPKDLPDLDVAYEQQRIEMALANLHVQGLAQLTWLPGQTWEDVQQAMLHGPWHIFHFIGHGSFDSTINVGVIALEDSAGQAHYLSAPQLGLLLTDHRPLRLVVLNSCKGASSGTRDIFSSTAATLVQHGIPAVLANQYVITDQAATELSRAFYEALAAGLPVDMAVTEARKAINLEGTTTLEWGTPVLHMRTPDGVLFHLPPPISPSEPATLPSTPALSPLPSTPVLAIENPYPPNRGKLAFDDPLSQPYQWDALPADSGGGPCQFVNGSYHISQSKSHTSYFSCCQLRFSNFAFEVQITIVHGNYGGIIFRDDDTNTKYYYFSVGVDGSYGLYVSIDGSTIKTLTTNFSSAITTGLNQPNTIAVVADGSRLDLYVNQQKIDSVSDSTYTSAGYIGLEAEAGASPTEVAFSNAKVWTW